jgi:hypothetical protein
VFFLSADSDTEPEESIMNNENLIQAQTAFDQAESALVVASLQRDTMRQWKVPAQHLAEFKKAFSARRAEVKAAREVFEAAKTALEAAKEAAGSQATTEEQAKVDADFQALIGSESWEAPKE